MSDALATNRSAEITRTVQTTKKIRKAMEPSIPNAPVVVQTIPRIWKSYRIFNFSVINPTLLTMDMSLSWVVKSEIFLR
jgi:hypothetical protein